jgi:hypothetical protein
VIDNQSEEELKVIMRSIYFDNGTHGIGRNLQLEVIRLNGLVLDFCVPRIMVEIDMYVQYLYDTQNPLSYMNHGANTSVKGSKTMELKTFL